MWDWTGGNFLKLPEALHKRFEAFYPCEHHNHGAWGPKDAPAYLLIEASCPGCDAEPRIYSICYEDWVVKRILVCPECGRESEQTEAWKALMRWY